jgi:hypothetical protein
VKLTDTQLLPYPEANDPGDGALDLQVLAEAIDAKLVAEFANFRSVLNDRQIEVVTLAADFGPVTANTDTFVSFDTVVFTSDGGSPFIGFDPAVTSGAVYAAGAYVISNPTGAVTANSSRTAKLSMSLYQGPSLNTFTTNTWISEIYETSTGGEHQQLVSVFYAPFPASSAINLIFRHANVASTVNVKAGSMMWLQRLGEIA